MKTLPLLAIFLCLCLHANGLDSDCKCVKKTPTSLSSYSKKVGKCFEFKVTGSKSGRAWGTGTYTADSYLARAAVHAGLVENGETKYVRVGILPGKASYKGSKRHGVATRNWGHYRLSFKFFGATSRGSYCHDTETETTEPSVCKCVKKTPTSLSSYSKKVGKCFEFKVTGSKSGRAWGTGTYTADSYLARAAVHAGLVENGETRYVLVGILPGKASYQGSSQNGVTTINYGHYKLSYKFMGVTSSCSFCQQTDEQSTTEQTDNKDEHETTTYVTEPETVTETHHTTHTYVIYQDDDNGDKCGAGCGEN